MKIAKNMIYYYAVFRLTKLLILQSFEEKKGDKKNLAWSLVSTSSRVRIDFKVPPTDRGDFKFILIDKDCLLNNPEICIINYSFHFEFDFFKMIN